MYPIQKGKYEHGQVVIIVVLVLVVGLLVGLSVAIRSITNLRLAREEENSQRAFSAAEAGIEQLLKLGQASLSSSFGNNTSFTASQVQISGSEFLINGGKTVFQDDGVDIWLIPHAADGSQDYSGLGSWQQIPGTHYLTIFWGLSTDPDVCTDNTTTVNTQAALEIISLSGNPAAAKASHILVDPCSARRSYNNGESDQTIPAANSTTVGGKTFLHKYTISFPDTSRGIQVRVIPLHAGTKIGAKPCNYNGSACSDSTNLPVQGSRVESLGTDSVSNTARKISVIQGYPKLPNEFYQYVLLNP